MSVDSNELARLYPLDSLRPETREQLANDAAVAAGRQSPGAAAIQSCAAPGSAARTAAPISSVVRTATVSTNGGGSSEVGPWISVTSAPSRHAARARA